MPPKPPDITFSQVLRDGNRERINTQEGAILAHILAGQGELVAAQQRTLAEQQRTNKLLVQRLPKPTLTVTKEGDDGKPEVLVKQPVTEGGKAAPSEAKGTDAAGVPFHLYEAAEGHPWGVALVLCKNGQAAMFSKWAKALALQGLEVRQYVIDSPTVLEHGNSTRSMPFPPEVLAYTHFRYKSDAKAKANALRQARAVYGVTEKILAASRAKPVAVFIWGHSEHWCRAPALACRDAGVQTLHVEGAMFPRRSWLSHGVALDSAHLIINRNGQYYESCEDIDALWERVKHEPLGEVATAQIDSYITAWKEAKASKYGQTPDPISSSPDERRVLFVPLQIDIDASMYYAEALVKVGEDLLNLVAEVASPKQWRIIAKRHPHDKLTENAEARYNSLNMKYGHMKVLDDGNIHDLIREADAVVGINSTVLMEACCYDKPVVALGSTCFTNKGFTHDVRDRDALAQLLRADRDPLQFSAEMRTKFRRFLYMLMYEGNDNNGFFVDAENFDAARLVCP